MNSNSTFSLTQRLKSFVYAFNGLKLFFTQEHNARVHLIASGLAILLGFIYKLTPLEWISIIVAIALVIIAEIVNTAIEHIANFISPNYHLSIKAIKDLGASAVLIASIAAASIGGIIFIPKL